MSDVEETGELIISEIMFSASDDNYIELYNPKNEKVTFDTLTTEVDAMTYNFPNVSLEAKGYLVIGRKAAPYVDIHTATTGGLPIVSTGSWITVKHGKNGPVIDRVICGGSNPAIGWATVSSSSKKSVELNRDKYSAKENNFGKNWSVASQSVEGTSLYGTPGR